VIPLRTFSVSDPLNGVENIGLDIAAGLKIGVDDGVEKGDYDNMFTRISDSIKNVSGSALLLR